MLLSSFLRSWLDWFLQTWFGVFLLFWISVCAFLPRATDTLVCFCPWEELHPSKVGDEGSCSVDDPADGEIRLPSGGRMGVMIMKEELLFGGFSGCFQITTEKPGPTKICEMLRWTKMVKRLKLQAKTSTTKMQIQNRRKLPKLLWTLSGIDPTSSCIPCLSCPVYKLPVRDGWNTLQSCKLKNCQKKHNGSQRFSILLLLLKIYCWRPQRSGEYL